MTLLRSNTSRSHLSIWRRRSHHLGLPRGHRRTQATLLGVELVRRQSQARLLQQGVGRVGRERCEVSRRQGGGEGAVLRRQVRGRQPGGGVQRRRRRRRRQAREVGRHSAHGAEFSGFGGGTPLAATRRDSADGGRLAPDERLRRARSTAEESARSRRGNVRKEKRATPQLCPKAETFSHFREASHRPLLSALFCNLFSASNECFQS